jgi:hypothetical protein
MPNNLAPIFTKVMSRIAAPYSNQQEAISPLGEFILANSDKAKSIDN